MSSKATHRASKRVVKGKPKGRDEVARWYRVMRGGRENGEGESPVSAEQPDGYRSAAANPAAPCRECGYQTEARVAELVHEIHECGPANHSQSYRHPEAEIVHDEGPDERTEDD